MKIFDKNIIWKYKCCVTRYIHRSVIHVLKNWFLPKNYIVCESHKNIRRTILKVTSSLYSNSIAIKTHGVYMRFLNSISNYNIMFEGFQCQFLCVTNYNNKKKLCVEYTERIYITLVGMKSNVVNLNMPLNHLYDNRLVLCISRDSCCIILWKKKYWKKKFLWTVLNSVYSNTHAAVFRK